MLFRKESPFTCNICGICFTRKDNMKRHMVRIHETTWKDCHTIETRTVCHFPSCNETYYQKTSFLKHLKEKHRVSIEVEEHTFASEGDFLVWKEKQETEQLAYFSKQTGEKSGNNCKLLYYSCQHDGHNKSHRAKGEPARKTNVKYKHGSIKTGKFCPACMTARIEPGKTSVVYIKSHNHPINIYNTQFQPIPKSVKTSVAAKLAFGVPVPQFIVILDQLWEVGNKGVRADLF